MTALHHSHARSHVTQTCNVLDVSLDVSSRAFFTVTLVFHVTATKCLKVRLQIKQEHQSITSTFNFRNVDLKSILTSEDSQKRENNF